MRPLGLGQLQELVAMRVSFRARRVGLGVFALAWAVGIAAGGQEHWVSATGDDGNAGTREAPLAALVCARDAVREAKQRGLPKGGLSVWLRGGVYPMANTLELDARDSGTAEAPATYRSVPGEEVRLVGGKQLPADAFKLVTDADVLERLDPAAQGKVVQADLKAAGITDYGQFTRRGGIERDTLPAALELFFNDRPMTLARWPNEGWTRIAAVPPEGPKGERFHYEGDRPKRWARADDIWVHGYFNRNWCDTYEKVAALDTASREVVTAPPHDYRGYKAGQRIRFPNVLEELDEPGEWYVDRATGMLYFWPPEPLAGGRAVVSLLETPLVALRGTEHVTLRGLILECTRGSAVEIVGGHHNLVAGCTLRNIGTVGVAIGGVVPDLERRVYRDTTFAGGGGTDNGVVSCEIHDTGEYGIILRGGDRTTLGAGRNYAVNNDIYRFSRWVQTYRPAVSLHGVGNRVAHNRMHDAPHNAVLFWGNDHVLEFNEVFRVCTETGDAGAFYIGRDWTQRGHVIRHNYFHDPGAALHREAGFNAVMAIYLDDTACGATVFGNIMCRVHHAILIGGGRDNSVENNLFVDCPLAISVDNRGFYGSADRLGCRLARADGPRHAVADALMRPVFVVESAVGVDHALQALEAKQNQVVQAFLPSTPNPTLAVGVGIGCVVGSGQRFHARALYHRFEVPTETLVPVMQEEAGGCPRPRIPTAHSVPAAPSSPRAARGPPRPTGSCGS